MSALKENRKTKKKTGNNVKLRSEDKKVSTEDE